MRAITFCRQLTHALKACMLITILSFSSNAKAEYYLAYGEQELPAYQPASQLPHSTHHGRSWINIYVSYPCACQSKWQAQRCHSCSQDHWAPQKINAYNTQANNSRHHYYRYDRYDDCTHRKIKHDRGFDDMSTGDDVQYHSDLEIND